MTKVQSNAEYLLSQLGELSSYLANINPNEKDYFEKPLNVMLETIGFDMSVLYEITNEIEDFLILNVARTYDPSNIRSDIELGKKIVINLKNPEKIYINEAQAYKTKHLSAINVPGMGCDIMGYVYIPESFGGGFLFGGDYCGKESDVQHYEIKACEIMCNLLSSILLKTQFEQLAIFDGLTGLFNSRAIKEKLEKSLKRWQRNPNAPISIVLCDIDHFKKINDTFGHVQGDMVLQEIGALLSKTTRESIDRAGRYGGEEFLIIYEGVDEKTTADIMNRLRKTIQDYPFKRIDINGQEIANESLNVTMSFGITCLRTDDSIQEIKELISQADAALYQSKEHGRNRVTIFKNPS